MANGFGIENYTLEQLLQYGIIASPIFDYEISFFVKTTKAGDFQLNFGTRCFDQYGVEYEMLTCEGDSSNGQFLSNFSLNYENKWVFVRGIIHHYNTSPLTDQEYIKLNVGSGNHLMFSSLLSRLIIPSITVNRVSGSVEDSEVYIWDFKVRNLRKLYSTGFVQTQNLVEIFTNYKNFDISFQRAEELIQKYLLPYQSVLKMVNIEQSLVVPPAEQKYFEDGVPFQFEDSENYEFEN